MKIVVAMDSFKGSLTSFDAGHAVHRGIEKAALHASRDVPHVRVLPLADGGEGTVTAMIRGLGGVYRTIKVRGPLKAQVEAIYGIVPSMDGTPAAVIEMAAASGSWLVPERPESFDTTTWCGRTDLHAISRMPPIR